jgi:D-aspartate ligase
MNKICSQKGALILGGAHSSLEIARSLGRQGIPVWLVTSDNPLARLSRYVQRKFWWQGPDSDDAAGYLIDLVRRHGLHGWVLFAGGDSEVELIARNHAALAASLTLTTPAWDVVRLSIDKRNMNTRAAELGLAMPISRYPGSKDDLANLGIPFPLIIKPTMRSSHLRSKAWRADNQRALTVLYEKSAAVIGADRIMVQELIPGDGQTQFSYAAVCERGTPIGSLVARRTRQYPVDFGFTSTLVESISSPQIEQAACRFIKSLDFSGLAEIEFKYDARDGQYKILDVNTRAWTWMALGAVAGVDFALLQWRLALGERIAAISAKPGVSWRYLSRDLVAAAQEVLAGTISPIAALHSLRHAAAAAVWASDDLLPAALDLPLVAARVLHRRYFGGRCTPATGLQSAGMT